MRSLRRLATFLKPYTQWAVLAPLFMLIEVSMDLLQPRLVQRIIDVGIANDDPEVIVRTGLLMVGIALVGLAGGALCTVYALLAAQHFSADLRGELFRKVQNLSFGNLDRLETGSLITRLTTDVTQVQDVVSMLLRIMVRAPLLLVGSVFMALVTSARLSLLFAALMPLILIALAIIFRRVYPLFGKVQERLDRVNTVMQENLAGVRVVRAFARAEHEIARFTGVNTELMERNITAVRTGAVTMPILILVVNLGIVGAIWFGGVQVDRGELEVGELVAFLNYLLQGMIALGMVSFLIIRMARAEASAERIGEVLDSKPDIVTPPAAREGIELRGKVEFRDVSFRYRGEAAAPVLRDISFVAQPGQTVAILGATGSGKSTLASLIPRFYDVTGGQVLLDDIDVREIDERTLHRQIGVALQESILFTGTIRDNIRYGRPDASDEEVERVARMAQAHDFIAGFEHGYDTKVGQRGVNLSGGQKQRIAIARALLVQPAILILDDSTSAVDVATEARIQAALATFPHTRFIVAQRISSVVGADQILVLEEGRLAGRGTHDELMATSPVYREIWTTQMERGVVAHG
jgi:ATP-binding cassette, subfamily B, multidrug efflux pump